MDCEIIQKTKARLALVASDGLDASRIPRTVRRSGCAPAEPYPPNRVRSLSKRLDCRQQKWVNQKHWARAGKHSL